MEKRIPFIIGDVLANMLVATVTTAAATWLIGGTWGMIAGAAAGMVLGMVIALLLCIPVLMTLLGAFEVLTPVMLSGMLGGMWGGMWPLAGSAILRWGFGTGLALVAVIYGLNAVLTSPQKFEV